MGCPVAQESAVPHIANLAKDQSLNLAVQLLLIVYSFHGIIESENCGLIDGNQSGTVCTGR